ncbi:MAG: sugar ABC transporter permease [Oscillospiraceae bacterium]|nr:sugar ABC transporter permease [Oscillospiraceae bacterium]
MLPGLLHYLMFRIGPSMMTAILSFTDITGVPNTPWKFIGLDNYREFLMLQNQRDLQRAFSRTIMYSVSVTFIQNALALFVAVVINNKFIKGRNIFRAVYFLPVILGVTIVTSVWKLLASIDGPIFAFMQQVLNNPAPLFANFTYAFPAVIGIQIWMYMGYSMVLYLAGMQNISLELYEAGYIDGCNEWKSFRFITFPLLWPIITVNVLLALIGSLQSFEIIYTTTQGQFNTTTLGMMVFATAFGGRGATAGGDSIASLRQGYAASMSMILFLGVFAVTLFSQYVMNKRGGDN